MYPLLNQSYPNQNILIQMQNLFVNFKNRRSSTVAGSILLIDWILVFMIFSACPIYGTDQVTTLFSAWSGSWVWSWDQTGRLPRSTLCSTFFLMRFIVFSSKPLFKNILAISLAEVSYKQRLLSPWICLNRSSTSIRGLYLCFIVDTWTIVWPSLKRLIRQCLFLISWILSMRILNSPWN